MKRIFLPSEEQFPGQGFILRSKSKRRKLGQSSVTEKYKSIDRGKERMHVRAIWSKVEDEKKAEDDAELMLSQYL